MNDVCLLLFVWIFSVVMNVFGLLSHNTVCVFLFQQGMLKVAGLEIEVLIPDSTILISGGMWDSHRTVLHLKDMLISIHPSGACHKVNTGSNQYSSVLVPK